MFALLISLLLLNPANDMTRAKTLTMQGDYEKSLQILESIKPSSVNYNEYCYLRAIDHFNLNQKKEAEEWTEKLGDIFGDVPVRYIVLSNLMKSDLSLWKEEKNDLGNIGRDMQQVGGRLKTGKAGKQTQAMQDDIVKRLDKIIKKKEDDMKKASESKSKSEAEQNEKMRKEIESQMKTPGNPLNDSKLGGPQGAGRVDPKKLREVANVWGKLPEKERAKAMVELTRNLPPKYRDAIEHYFRELQQKSGK